MRRDHFSRIDLERENRGVTPLAEQLTAILHEHEQGTGISRKIVELQERIREVLDREELQLFFDLEHAHVTRLIDAERLAFNTGFDFGAAHGRARDLGSPGARELAVEVGELLATSDAQVHEIVVALAAVMAGVMAPYDA